MKGIVFTELIEMVEADLGLEIADQMILGAKMAPTLPWVRMITRS
jgi:hypothetical protein